MGSSSLCVVALWLSGSMRALSSFGPALPYIARLIVFRRLIWPSAWPLLPRQFDGVVDGLKITVQDACEPFNATKPELNASSIQLSSLPGSRLGKIPRKHMPRLRNKPHSGEPCFKASTFLA